MPRGRSIDAICHSETTIIIIIISGLRTTCASCSKIYTSCATYRSRAPDGWWAKLNVCQLALAEARQCHGTLIVLLRMQQLRLRLLR
jgi:hypothetical protein